MILFTKVPTVIRPENHYGVCGGGTSIQGIQQTAHRGVGIGDACQVSLKDLPDSVLLS